MSGQEKQFISKKRVADHGEVFTAKREVEAMLDLVKQETERIDSRFLEPACGNGNFLIAILERKLAVVERMLANKEKKLRKSEKRPGWKANEYIPLALEALTTIYGIDILESSIEAAKARLLTYFKEYYHKVVEQEITREAVLAAKFILDKNILLGDAINTQDYVTIPGVPGLDQIIFTEWGRVDRDFKRREFRFITMHLDGMESDNRSEAVTDDLFAEEKQPTHKIHTTDSGKDIMKPLPIREYPFTNYAKLADGERYAI